MLLRLHAFHDFVFWPSAFFPHALQRYLGSAVAMLYVPYICVHLGAMKQFKISGVLALLWLAMWSRVGSDRPEDGNNLSTSSIHVPTLEEESGVDLFINSKKEDPAPLLSRNSGSTGSNGRGSPTGSSRNKVDTNSVGIGGGGSGGSSVNIPWAVLVKSSAVWAILTSNFAFHYASYVLMNWLPTYFENHLGVPLSDIGSWYSVSFPEHRRLTAFETCDSCCHHNFAGSHATCLYGYWVDAFGSVKVGCRHFDNASNLIRVLQPSQSRNCDRSPFRVVEPHFRQSVYKNICGGHAETALTGAHIRSYH